MRNMGGALRFSLLLLTIPSFVLAVAPTGIPSGGYSKTPTPTTEQSKKIEDLKDRLATKVAELRQKERRAMYGIVKSVSVSTIHIDMDTRDVKIEVTDDMKVFENLKGKRTNLTTEDIVKDDAVTVFGEYDPTIELLRAKVVFIESAPVQKISGIISDVNKKDYSVTVTTPQDVLYIIDYETYTKTSVWSSNKDLVKAGFSKLSQGDTVFVAGTAVPKKEKRISAFRIVNIGNLTGETPISTPTPTDISPTPSLKP